MAIEYKVKLSQDVRYDKTKGYASVLARVVELDNGSEKKITGGNVVFSRSGEADVSKPLTNSSAKLDFEKDREDEKRLVKVYAEYTDPRGITEEDNIIVEIDAKKPQPPDTHSKITLFLADVIAQEVEDDKTEFKTVARLRGLPHDKLDERFPVELFLDDAAQPNKPLTEKRSGDAYVKFTLGHGPRKQQFRLTARVRVDGKDYFSTNDRPITVSAKNAPEAKWEFSHLDVDLKGECHPADEPDHHNFILKVEVKKFERRIDNPAKIQPARLMENDVYKVRYRENFTKELVEKPETDKNGFAEIEISYPAEDRSKRMTFIAEVELEVADPADTTKKIKKKFVSNEYHETLPKKTKTPTNATTLGVYCEDNMARVTGKDKDDKPCTASLTMTPARPSVIVRDAKNTDITGDITVPATGGTFFFFDDPKPNPDPSKPHDPTPDPVRVSFAIVGFSTIDLIFPRSK